MWLEETTLKGATADGNHLACVRWGHASILQLSHCKGGKSPAAATGGKGQRAKSVPAETTQEHINTQQSQRGWRGRKETDMWTERGETTEQGDPFCLESTHRAKILSKC